MDDALNQNINQSNMTVEQNKQPQLSKKYNLFSPAQTIQLPRGYSANNKSKREIKLVFHHPNLLFLNPNKQKTKQQVSQQIGKLLLSPKVRTKHSSKSSNQFRPYTSYLQSKGSRGNTALNTPSQKRKNSQQMLQVCGKSSGLGNEHVQMYKVDARPIKTSGDALNLSCQSQMNDENLFRFMQGMCGKQKKIAWGQLMHTNKRAVRLNMYLQVQKKYNKYVNKCR